jgi:hypothetical protein
VEVDRGHDCAGLPLGHGRLSTREIPLRFDDDPRVVVFPDGVVVFDPVDWSYRTLAPDGLELLELLREHVVSEGADRERLLGLLLEEAAAADGLRVDELESGARAQLVQWVDLALHMYG